MAAHLSVLTWEPQEQYKKDKKDITPEDEPPRLEGVQYASGVKKRAIISSMKEWSR